MFRGRLHGERVRDREIGSRQVARQGGDSDVTGTPDQPDFRRISPTTGEIPAASGVATTGSADERARLLPWGLLRKRCPVQMFRCRAELFSGEPAQSIRDGLVRPESK